MLFFPFPDDHPRTFCEDLVLATPEVREHTLEEGDDFLVLATDGLWDVLSPQGVSHTRSLTGDLSQVYVCIGLSSHSEVQSQVRTR